MDSAEFNRKFPSIYGAKVDAENRAFNVWFAKVNAIILRKTGLCADDLPDYCYRDAYDDGATAVNTANRAIRAAKEY